MKKNSIKPAQKVVITKVMRKEWFDAGKAAFAAGLHRAPNREVFCSYSYNQRLMLTYGKEYLAGWDTAMLAAPITGFDD